MSLPPNQLRFTPHSTYYSRFFLLRTTVSIGGQPAVVNFDSGQLTLNCRLPHRSVAFPAISAQLEDILKKFGVLNIGNFFCEDVPLYQVTFSSEYTMKRFLQSRSKVESEVASLISSTLSQPSEVDHHNAPEGTDHHHAPKGANRHNAPAQPIPTTVQADLFLVSPDTEKSDARIVHVTLENYTTCMALWKESEVFDFGAAFRVYRLDPRKLPGGGAVTLKALVTELQSVKDWFHLGVHLQVQEEDLMAIRYKYETSRDLRASKTDLFITWLNSSEQPTWAAVVRALVGIGMRSLAVRLGMKYGASVPPSNVVMFPSEQYATKQVTAQVLENAHQQMQKLTGDIDMIKKVLTEENRSLQDKKKAKAITRSQLNYIKRTLRRDDSKFARLQARQRQVAEMLRQKREELRVLKLELEGKQKVNKELSIGIQKKEEEIEQLNEQLTELKSEIKHMTDELLHATSELEVKAAHVEELERANTQLKNKADRDHQIMNELQQSVWSERMRACSAIFEQQQLRDHCLTLTKKEESYQQEISEKNQEMQSLTERLQVSSLQFDEVMGQRSMPSADETLEEGAVKELVLDISDLRVQLADARIAKAKVEQEMEAVQEQQKEMSHRIKVLGNMLSEVTQHFTNTGDVESGGANKVDLRSPSRSSLDPLQAKQKSEEKVPTWIELYNAAESGDVEAVQRIISSGVDVNQSNERGYTALHIAAKKGHVPVVAQLLRSKADPTLLTKSGAGLTPLMIACDNGNEHVTTVLLDAHGDLDQLSRDKEWTALMRAINGGHLGCVQKLIGRGATVNIKDPIDEWTALHLASSQGHSNILTELVTHGANVQAATKRGFTALHLAIEKGYSAIVKQLLSSKADVHAVTEEYWTALHYASSKGHGDIIKVLVDHGADIEATTQSGFTSLHYACQEGKSEAVRALLQRGADLRALTKTGNSVTPLQVACLYNHSHIINLLVSLGADINQLSGNRLKTALIFACEKGHINVIHKLLQAGAAVDKRNKLGHTALSLTTREDIKAVLRSYK